MSRRFLAPVMTALCLLALALSPMVLSAADTPLPEPTLEQRIQDLEAYVNNGARTAEVASKIPGPGPGHNA